MKKMFILLLCLAAVVGLQAQTAIPYTQGFESSSMPTGWVHVGSGTAACATSYPHSGTYSLKFSGATSDNVVKLPTFTQEIANLEISFWSRPEGSSSGSFDIGYLTNPASASTFVTLETYSYASEGTTYHQYFVSFAGAPAGSVIAMRHRSASTAWYWFIDDVEVYAAPTCIAVGDLRLTEIDSSSATISWSSDGSAWRIDLIDAEGDTLTSNATDSTYTFYGLTPSTSYTAIVYTDCGGGELSRAKTISFRTECGQMAFPYMNNFELCETNVMVPCWTVMNEPSSSPVKVYGSSSSYSNFSPKFLYINGPATIATPKTPIPLNQVEVSFDYTLESMTSIPCFYMGYATNLAGEITWFDTVTPPAGYVNHAVANYITDLSDIDVTDEGYIIISREGSSGYLLAIDNFAMNAIPNCARPTDVSIFDITNERAVASWRDTIGVGAFDIAYGTVNDVDSDSTQIVSVSDTTYTFENLPENTQYYIWVRSDCSGETSPWIIGGSFRTACNPYATDSLPYVEDFDSYAASSSVNFNSCWTIKQSGTSYSPYISSSSYLSGSKSLYFNNCCAAMPMMESDINTLQLTFWVKYSSTYPFAVGIMANPSDPNTFDTVATGMTSSTWSKVEVPLGGYTGTGRYIAIRTNNYMYVDDLTIDFMPACPSPTNFRVDSLDADYAEVSWTENGSATTWTVELVAGANTETATAYSNERFELSNLTPNTLYTVNIYPECSDSIHLTATFRTPCVPVDTLPYFDDFESYTASSSAEMNPCWKTYTSGSYHYPYISSTSPYSGSRCLYFSSSSNYYLALPMFEEPINTLQISFYKKYSSSYPFAVGVMTDPNNLATFDTIATGTTTSTWQLVEVPFGGYTGSGRYIAIRTNNYMYIDDLTVDLMPACPRPSNLVVDSVASDMVALSWTENGEATSWTVVYGVDNDSMSVTASSNEGFEITGLDANTGYWVKIYSDCSEPGEPLEASFRTACGELTLPYSENFNAATVNEMIPCWQIIEQPSSYPIKVNNVYNYTNFNSNYLYINGPATIATPMTPIALNEVEVSFDYSFENASYISTFYVGYATSTSGTVTYFDTVNAPAGYVSKSVQHYSRTLSDLDFDQPAYIIINRAGSSNYLLAIDNFMMNEIPECIRPQDLEYSSIDGTSINVSWTDLGGAGFFDLAWGQVNDIESASTQRVSVSDTAYTITPIEPNSTYYVWVRTNCGSDSSNWVAFDAITTPCVVVTTLPWIEDFESMPVNQVPGCWDNTVSTTSSATANPYYVWGVFSANGNNSIRMYNYLTQSGYAAINTPAIQLPASGNYLLNFSYSHLASSDSLYVKVSTDGINFTTLRGFYRNSTTYSYTDPGTFHDVEIDISAYAGETVIFQFANQSNYGSGAIFVDNLRVGAAPTCLRVASVDVDATTSTSITVSWTAAGEETAWDVTCVPSGSEPDYDNAVPATTNSMTITGLTPNTAYDIYVRSNCGSGDFGDPRKVVARTECGTMTLPYLENFNDYTAGSTTQPSCWFDLTTGSASAPYIQDMSSSYSSWATSYAYHLYGTNVVVSPRLPLPLNQVDIKFLLSKEGASSNSLIVGFIPSLSSSIDNMTVLATYNYSTYKQYIEEELSAVNTTITDTGYIVFKSTGSTSYYWWIDDFNVTLPATCARPAMLRTADVADTTATIAWTSTASQFEVNYRTVGGTWTSVVTNDTMLVLSGLTPQTTYEYQVRTICSSTDTSAWTRTASFTTACAAVAIPYVETFESAATGSSVKFSACWNVYSTGTYYYPYVSTTASYAYEGSRSLYFGTTSYYYAAMPLMGEDLDLLQVSFMARSSSTTSGTILVGVMTDPTNVDSFEQIESVNIPGNTYEQHVVYFSSYLGTGRYIAFRNGGSAVVYLDSIAVDYKPSCTPPSALALSAVSTNSATITWFETGAATSWEPAYRAMGDTAWTLMPAVNTTSATLTGLVDASLYEFRVRAICTDTSNSEWSSIFSFRTNCTDFALPFMEDFNSQTVGEMPACWTILNYNSTAPKVYNSYTYTNLNSNYLWLNYPCTVATPRIAKPINQLGVDFDMSFENTSYNGPLYIGYTTDLVNVVYTDTVNFPAGYVNKSVFHHSTNFFNLSVTDTGFVVFQSTGTNNYLIAIDNLEIDVIPTCPRVDDLEATAVTETSVTIDWTDLITPMAYEVDYGEVGHDAGTGSRMVVNSHPVTISGLNPATTYDIYVRPICSTTDTGYWTRSACHATTACGLVAAPYVQNFDGITGTTYSTAGELVPCWEGYTNGTSDIYTPHVVGSGSYYYATSGNSLVMTCGATTYGDTKIVRLPEFQQPVNSLTVSYWMATESNTNGTLSVGYLTSDDFSTFVSVKDITASSSTYYTSGSGSSVTGGIYDTVSFDSVPAEAMYVAFRWYFVSSSFYSCCIDEVAVESSIVGCQAPVIVSTTNDYNSFTATWSGASDNYEVSYMSASDADYSTPVAVNAHTYTLTGLTPATLYNFRVRALCDSSDVSAWTNVNFTTDSLPCFAIEDLHQTAITYTSVTLDWTNGGNEQNWVVKVFNSRIGEILDTVSAHPATITGLTANEQYFAAVQAACGSNLDGFSEWSDTISFTTSECVAVSNISCATPTNSSVEISWTSNGSESAWIVEYGMPGFGQGEELGRATATSNPYQLSLAGLDPNTTYEVYVYAQCMEGLTSVPAGPASFTTNDIGISGISGNADINIYPNPTTGSTTISVNGISGKVNVAIVDMNGREVMSSAMECDGDCEKVMNVEGLAQGAYFVRIYGEEINSIRKLIVR